MLANITNMFRKNQGWSFFVITSLGVLFIVYKSIYQSASHLNDLVSFFVLVVLCGISYHNKNRWGNWSGALLIILLYFPPLYWLWRSGQYDTTSIAGLLPVQDMFRYYGDALRLHYGYPFSPIGSWRPIFSGYMSVILKLTDENLQAALIVLAIFVVVSIIFLADEIKKNFGSFSAMLVVVVLYYCYKGYGFIGKIMTEQLGLPLGALALALFLQGIRLQNKKTILLGLFTLSFALNVRAGALFILPMIVLWGAGYLRDKRVSVVEIGVFLLAGISGFFINYLVFTVIGNSNTVLFGNFANTFYGLATGYRGWSAVVSDYGVYDGSLLWPQIIDVVRENPGNLALGIFRAYADYFKPEIMFRFLYFPAGAQTLVSYVLYGLTFLGIIRLFRMRNDIASFLLFSLAGLFLSIPFVPPIDDGLRAMTVTIPFSALILALPLSSVSQEPQKLPGNRLISGYALGYIALCVLGPMVIFLFPEQPPVLSARECEGSSTPLDIWVKPGSFVRVVENELIPYSLVPDLRVRDLRSSIAKYEFDFFNEGSAVLRRVDPGQTILVGHDLRSLSSESGAVIVIVPNGKVVVGQINQFCAEYLTTDNWGDARIFIEQSLDPSDFLASD